MPMYNLIKNRGNYSKTSGSLWEFYRDEPFMNNDDTISDSPPDNNNSALSKFKTRIAARIGNDDCNWSRTNNHLVHKGTPNHLGTKKLNLGYY